MKTALITVALLLASHWSSAQRFFELTNGSWNNQNLSVETFQDFIITGFTEVNPATGLLTPTFKVTNIGGGAVSSFYVNFPDAMYMMDFTMRPATNTIILTGMTAVTSSSTPFKMFVAEVNFLTGAPVQSFIEYTSSGNSMVPHQVIHSEPTGQVTIVGTEMVGLLTSSNYATIPKSGFVLGLDINNYGNILYPPVEMNTPVTSTTDNDMLENLTEVPGVGYFISGSANGSGGEQNLFTMGINYGGGVTHSRIIDNTNSRYAGSSVMYHAGLGLVFLLANNSVIHQFQIAQCNAVNGAILSGFISHQIIGLPIGSGVDENGFRLQQNNAGEILIAGYLSAPLGALPQKLTPFQLLLKNNMNYISGKIFQSGNNAPLSPSYFEESGNSVYINTPDMFVYNQSSDRTYVVSQNNVNGGYDLNISATAAVSGCERAFKTTMFSNTPVVIGVGSFNPLPMYAVSYMPAPSTRTISGGVLCQQATPATISTDEPQTGVIVSPNPASELLNITLEDGEAIQNVTIYDLKGNRVLTQDAADRSLNETTLNIDRLNNGTYMIVITSSTGILYREKLIKE